MAFAEPAPVINMPLFDGHQGFRLQSFVYFRAADAANFVSLLMIVHNLIDWAAFSSPPTPVRP